VLPWVPEKVGLVLCGRGEERSLLPAWAQRGLCLNAGLYRLQLSRRIRQRLRVGPTGRRTPGRISHANRLKLGVQRGRRGCSCALPAIVAIAESRAVSRLEEELLLLFCSNRGTRSGSTLCSVSFRPHGNAPKQLLKQQLEGRVPLFRLSECQMIARQDNLSSQLCLEYLLR
jgi:hypothetical protein